MNTRKKKKAVKRYVYAWSVQVKPSSMYVLSYHTATSLMEQDESLRDNPINIKRCKHMLYLKRKKKLLTFPLITYTKTYDKPTIKQLYQRHLSRQKYKFDLSNIEK